MSLTSVSSLTGHSKATVSAFYAHFRQLITATLVEDDVIIGGPGVIVEVDETKLGNRKFNRGHWVEGVWIIAGVERTPERRVFLVLLNLGIQKQLRK